MQGAEDIHINSPQDAQNAGISTVYQEITLCPNLTVAENMYIGRGKGRITKWKKMNEDADKILDLIKASGGKLDFYDKSDPELIRERTGMSKNEFKRAVGKLLKEDRISIGEGTISLK